MTTSTDRIERKGVINAPIARVWRAISDYREFGEWFRVALERGFEPGARVTGRITHPGYEHIEFVALVEKVEPERLLSFRWHPAAIERDVDYSKEPTTLVELALAPHPDGTVLTVTESGFDALPEARAAHAFRINDGGWRAQLENVQRHVASA